jgi:hypothetical protein
MAMRAARLGWSQGSTLGAALIRSYGLPVSDTVASYVERLAKAASVCEWVADALAEHDFVAEDEPYRQAPNGAQA